MSPKAKPNGIAIFMAYVVIKNGKISKNAQQNGENFKNRKSFRSIISIVTVLRHWMQ